MHTTNYLVLDGRLVIIERGPGQTKRAVNYANWSEATHVFPIRGGGFWDAEDFYAERLIRFKDLSSEIPDDQRFLVESAAAPCGADQFKSANNAGLLPILDCMSARVSHWA